MGTSTIHEKINLPNNGLPTSARVLLLMLKQVEHGQLTLHTPDGQHWVFGSSGNGRSACLQIKDWRACSKLVRGGGIGFAEAYREGWLDSPDLTALLRLALENQNNLIDLLSGTQAAQLWYRLRHWMRPNSRSGSRRNIYQHYDLGNDFYRLWLDPGWSYSSAWFNGDYQQSLLSAQQAKYQRIIERLNLQPGQRVLEIGCGWGGFAEQAALQGIEVHGVTISSAQYRFAQQRLRHHFTSRIELCDYRDIHGQYDAVVSIEMFEAVGEAYWPQYMAKLHACLKPGASALVQSIVIDERYFERYRAGSDFIQQFIFPGGMLPSAERFTQAAQQQGLQLQERFEFGHDYAETLRRWRNSFEWQLAAVRDLGFDEEFIRLWRLYFAYCEAGFEAQRIGVSQFILQRQ